MKTCKYLHKKDWIPAKFHGIYQRSEIALPSPMIGGHQGGTLMFPVAVVEDEHGLHEVEVWRVKDIKIDD